MSGDTQIIEALFSTKALKVSDADHPFWYTSGLFGPYYINTHFLAGGEEKANELLKVIEEACQCPLALPRVVGKCFVSLYHTDELYKTVIDHLSDLLLEDSFDIISGGERRDYFFSFALAEKLQKPHLAILKDGRAFLSSPGFKEAHEVHSEELKNQRVVHVADLVTEASSYQRTWIPTIQEAGGSMARTIAVVDRHQGGCAYLASQGVSLSVLEELTPEFFDQAVAKTLLTPEQAQQAKAFLADPNQYIDAFLVNHPSFLEEESKRDTKTQERVRRFMDIHPTSR